MAEKSNDNLRYYNAHRKVPQEALKPINAGRLKGMSDINPMFRIKSLTEDFGACGIGWYYTVDKQWLEVCGNETVALVNISLYVKVDGEWSKPIFGTGGSKLVAMEKNGAYVSDECVDGDCEILTKHGWVKFKDYDGEEEIAQFNKNTNEISFTKPLRFIHKKSSNTYKKGNITMTYGHRNLYDTAKGERRVDIAENLCGYEGRNMYDIRCGYYGDEIALTPMQKVGIMLCCDGTKHSVLDNGNIVWNVAFAKERKIKRCKELLKDAGIEIKYEHTSKRENPSHNDYTQIRFELDDTDYKKYESFLPYANYSHLFDELIFWDGNYSQYVKNGDASYFSVSYENITHIQTLLMMANHYSSIYTKERESENHSTVYTLYKHKHNRKKSTPIRQCGELVDVYCVEVPTTFFMLRKDNEIIVTGNCYKMATTDALSVACKQLGYGADVYWAKDRTKYTTNDNESVNQPKQQTPQNSATEAELNQKMADSVNKNLIPQTNEKISDAQLEMLKKEMERTGITLKTILSFSKTKTLEEMSQVTAVAVIDKLGRTKDKG